MRILVVEDELLIAKSLKKGLEQEAYAVDMVHDGEDGYDLAMVEEYDVIILDRMLPGMSGEEVCQQLREQGVKSPILMLTARGQIHERVEGLDVGADDYMVKPFAFEELLARIRALIRRPVTQVENVLEVGNLSLDTGTFAVKRGDVVIKLSRKEFSLLEYLMRHVGQIVTKDQIIQHVWNYDADVLPNTVEVYIGYLRNKVDKPFPDQPKLIQTVRGFGYRIGE
jgi:DNA-binding response OmpR family regulator